MSSQRIENFQNYSISDADADSETEAGSGSAGVLNKKKRRKSANLSISDASDASVAEKKEDSRANSEAEDSRVEELAEAKESVIALKLPPVSAPKELHQVSKEALLPTAAVNTGSMLNYVTLLMFFKRIADSVKSLGLTVFFTELVTYLLEVIIILLDPKLTPAEKARMILLEKSPTFFAIAIVLIAGLLAAHGIGGIIGLVAVTLTPMAPFIFTAALAYKAFVNSIYLAKQTAHYLNNPWELSKLNKLRLGMQTSSTLLMIGLAAIIVPLFVIGMGNPFTSPIFFAIFAATAVTLFTLHVVEKIATRAMQRSQAKAYIENNNADPYAKLVLTAAQADKYIRVLQAQLQDKNMPKKQKDKVQAQLTRISTALGGSGHEYNLSNIFRMDAATLKNLSQRNPDIFAEVCELLYHAHRYCLNPIDNKAGKKPLAEIYQVKQFLTDDYARSYYLAAHAVKMAETQPAVLNNCYTTLGLGDQPDWYSSARLWWQYQKKDWAAWWQSWRHPEQMSAAEYYANHQQYYQAYLVLNDSGLKKAYDIAIKQQKAQEENDAQAVEISHESGHESDHSHKIQATPIPGVARAVGMPAQESLPFSLAGTLARSMNTVIGWGAQVTPVTSLTAGLSVVSERIANGR